MDKKEIFSYVYEECPIATISYLDENYLPKSHMIEVIGGGKGGLYFLLDRDQEVARDLIRKKSISFLSYIDGSSLKTTEYVNIQGEVKRSDESWELLIKLNPDLERQYPDQQSRLLVFLFFIHEGRGSIKLKGKRPEFFTFGQPQGESYIYEVNNRCVRCMDCVKECPVEAIQPRHARVHINQDLCIHCSACYKICAFSAIDRR